MLGQLLRSFRVKSVNFIACVARQPVNAAFVVLSIFGLSFAVSKFVRNSEDKMSNRPVDDKKASTRASDVSKLTRASIHTLAAEKEFAKHKSLADFGYHFTGDGELRDIESGKGFEFKVKDDQRFNQKRYEMIGEFITEHVYELLEKEAKLHRINVPLDAKEDQPQSFIFASDDYKTNKDKLMVLIHGSGVVRAGQWARRLIINNNLKCGTQLPYIERAKQEGYAVIVLNTNLNHVEENGQKKPIPGNGQPEEHGMYVWKNIINKLPAKHIALVAHSYGGIVTTHLAREFAEEFNERVFAIAFTDSVHNLQWQQAPESVHNLFQQRAQNWVASDEKLDTPVRAARRDAPCVSAGHDTHEWTSWSAIESIFAFFNKKYPASYSSSDL